MFAFILVVCALVFILLTLVEATKPTRSRFSLFELERRAESGDQGAIEILEREKQTGKILVLKRTLVSLLMVLAVALLMSDFGILIGALLSAVAAIIFIRMASLRFVRKLANKFYSHYENKVLRLVKNKNFLFGKADSQARGLKISSREEFQYLLAESQSDFLSPDEKKMVASCLDFDKKTVSEVMTARDEIVSVKRSEYLGPLALDELHRTGHSKLPVISGDLNHVIGILHLERLLSLDEKRSTTADKVMEAKVYYINENHSLRQAVDAFVEKNCGVLIAVNDAKETVGLLTLKDVAGALFGQ